MDVNMEGRRLVEGSGREEVLIDGLQFSQVEEMYPDQEKHLEHF